MRLFTRLEDLFEVEILTVFWWTINNNESEKTHFKFKNVH